MLTKSVQRHRLRSDLADWLCVAWLAAIVTLGCADAIGWVR